MPAEYNGSVKYDRIDYLAEYCAGVACGGRDVVWRPFGRDLVADYSLERNLTEEAVVDAWVQEANRVPLRAEEIPPTAPSVEEMVLTEKGFESPEEAAEAVCTALSDPLGILKRTPVAHHAVSRVVDVNKMYDSVSLSKALLCVLLGVEEGGGGGEVRYPKLLAFLDKNISLRACIPKALIIADNGVLRDALKSHITEPFILSLHTILVEGKVPRDGLSPLHFAHCLLDGVGLQDAVGHCVFFLVRECSCAPLPCSFSEKAAIAARLLLRYSIATPGHGDPPFLSEILATIPVLEAHLSSQEVDPESGPPLLVAAYSLLLREMVYLGLVKVSSVFRCASGKLDCVASTERQILLQVSAELCLEEEGAGAGPYGIPLYDATPYTHPEFYVGGVGGGGGGGGGGGVCATLRASQVRLRAAGMQRRKGQGAERLVSAVLAECCVGVMRGGEAGVQEGGVEQKLLRCAGAEGLWAALCAVAPQVLVP